MYEPAYLLLPTVATALVTKYCLKALESVSVYLVLLSCRVRALLSQAKLGIFVQL